jgi:hypothetical protein
VAGAFCDLGQFSINNGPDFNRDKNADVCCYRPSRSANRLQACKLWPNLAKRAASDGAPVGGSVMNKPLIAAFVLAATAGLLAGSARAADLGVPGPGVQAADECGPCGCVHVSYDYHRELRSTYGLAFDPRNFDQTQPYYYLGPVRAWPRFECDVAVYGVGKGKSPPPVEAPPPVVTK